MNNARGSTIVELIVASAILLAVVTSVAVLLHGGLAQTPVIEEATDLHQRVRVATDTIAADLRAAAAGDRAAPLSDFFAPLAPRLPEASPASAARGVVTARYVPPHGASSRLVADLVPRAGSAMIEGAAGCPRNTVACGFTSGTTALVFDENGHWNLLSVDGIAPGVLTIGDVHGARPLTYPSGSAVVEAVEITYALDAPSRTIRRTQGAAGFPFVDHVIDLWFEYFDGTLTPLPLSLFTDGPFRGAGNTAFDVDLLRIRHVRAAVRVEAALDRLRGTDPRFFARPGTGRGTRILPDLVATIDVAVRNGRR